MAWPSAQTVVTQAALELGLIQSASDWGDDVFTSTDSTVAQFRALLKKAGRDLVDAFNWQQLRAEYSILTPDSTVATANNQSTWGAFPLPWDWQTMVDQSGWNRTSRLPLSGSLSEQEWQYLASRQTGVVWTVLFKQAQGLMRLYPSTSVPSGQALTVAYKSSWWVQRTAWFSAVQQWAPAHGYGFGDIVNYQGPGRPFAANFYRCVRPGTSGVVGPDSAVATSPYSPVTSGVLLDGTCAWNWIGCNYLSGDGTGTAYNLLSFGNSDSAISGADTLMFNEELVVSKLKLLWLKAKGFDSTDTENDYERNFMQATSNDVAAPILSLNGQGIVRDRLLGALNIPITGFGN